MELSLQLLTDARSTITMVKGKLKTTPNHLLELTQSLQVPKSLKNILYLMISRHRQYLLLKKERKFEKTLFLKRISRRRSFNVIDLKLVVNIAYLLLETIKELHQKPLFPYYGMYQNSTQKGESAFVDYQTTIYVKEKKFAKAIK